MPIGSAHNFSIMVWQQQSIYFYYDIKKSLNLMMGIRMAKVSKPHERRFEMKTFSKVSSQTKGRFEIET
jgi:hypothetical protein